MGLFERFKKVKGEPKKQNVEQELPFEVSFSTNQNGTFQVDFYDKFPKPRQFYDTTRLIVDPRPLVMNNKYVLNGAVSWYGQDDAIILDDRGQESGRRSLYRGILAQIDLNLLQTDANYCYTVMKQLLEKSRIEKYLCQGLEKNPERPCGKYIGGVEIIENEYKKIFDANIGRESHYSKLMIDRRRENDLKQQIEQEEQIRRKQEQINKIQEEIDNMR